MLTSAFWHGVYSGYYLSMLTVPFILVAEDLARRKIRHLVLLINFFKKYFHGILIFFLSPTEPTRVRFFRLVHEDSVVFLHGHCIFPAGNGRHA